MTGPVRGRLGLSVSGRWTIGALIVIVALIVAIWPRGGPASDLTPTNAPAPGNGSFAGTGGSVTPEELARSRQNADLEPCPVSDSVGPVTSPMAGVVLPCLSDGQPIELATATLGMPLVLNVWAYWCGPCRKELPVVAEFAAQAKGKVQVLTVHGQDGAQDPLSALSMLADIGVRLPTVVDTDAQLARAIEVPRVYPCTVLVRGDGTVAAVLPQVFDTSAELSAAVEEHLGVAI